MKVLVTGGAGYIGTELIYSLATNHAISDILIYDNLSRRNYNLFFGTALPGSINVEFLHGDILDSRKLREVLKDVDVVYHLAAKVSTPFSNEEPHQFDQVNHWGTAELSYAVEESNVKKLIYLSSTSVYGVSDKPLTEQSPVNPQTHYGISKLRAEKVLSRLAKQVDLYILRCGNVFGYSPSMRFDAVINKFIFEAQFNNRITIHGNGKQHRAFIHIKNVVNALNKLIDSNLKSGTYNLVGQNLSILEISSIIKEIYPELEMIFIQQNTKLRNLLVDTDNYLYHKGLVQKRDLRRDLLDFKDHFSFKPHGVSLSMG